MKNKIIALTLSIVLVLYASITVYASTGKAEQDQPTKPTSTITAQVVTVSSVIDGNAQLTAIDGNGWYLTDRADLKPKEWYIVIFDDNGTLDIYDDSIINIVPFN